MISEGKYGGRRRGFSFNIKYNECRDNHKIDTKSSWKTYCYEQASQEGELHEVHGLKSRGRVKYLPNRANPSALNTLVRRGDHVILSTSLRLANLISQSFSKTGQYYLILCRIFSCLALSFPNFQLYCKAFLKIRQKQRVLQKRHINETTTFN